MAQIPCYYTPGIFQHRKVGTSKIHSASKLREMALTLIYTTLTFLFSPRLVEFMANIPYQQGRMQVFTILVTADAWVCPKCNVSRTCTMESRNCLRSRRKRWENKRLWQWNSLQRKNIKVCMRLYYCLHRCLKQVWLTLNSRVYLECLSKRS